MKSRVLDKRTESKEVESSFLLPPSFSFLITFTFVCTTNTSFGLDTTPT